MSEPETTVEVAVRIRPQNAREQIDMCRVCTFCTPGQPQIVLGKDKAFTYDFVFDTDSQQEHIYSTSIEPLVEGCFDGYNATVLAYGQTGSGKTYTMGTGFGVELLPEMQGMIPRAVEQIFTGIEERRAAALERNEPAPRFEITVQFLELYNEELIDLFDSSRETCKKLRIHEDIAGGICIPGVTTQKVESEDETLACLQRGALSRTVGSTNMNAQSSRSHAIFTLLVQQQRPIKAALASRSGQGGSPPSQPAAESDWENLTAKFHFVDLAGSERLKRTGATGERAKEGISINCGLLSLGNVISALGDTSKKISHVPYRDSKLTRLLQDSLGGNSRTLMIACISPTDRDFMETLNTLKYSNRARNIKNKVVVNKDKSSAQLAVLRSRIQELELELQEFRSGRMVVSDDGSVVMNDMANEITMLRTENDKLRLRVKAMQQVIQTQSDRIAADMADRVAASLNHQDESTGQVVAKGVERMEQSQLSSVIKVYIRQIEELKSRLVLSESLAHQNPGSPFRRAPSSVRMPRLGSASAMPFEQETEDLLETARSDIQRLREREERKVSVSDMTHHHHSHRKRLHSCEAASTPPPPDRAGPSAGDGEERERPPTVFEFDEESNSSNEDDSDGSDELTLPGSDSSEDSDSDNDDTASLASSIAELSSEINLKQQLVEQLEKAQKSLYTMKQQYEEKMVLLQQQIRSIESERDKVLKEITTRRDSENQERKVREIKKTYEKQLTGLKLDLKSLKAARKEHARAMKKNAQYELELKRLKGGLLDMKKQRVKMISQMRTEASTKKVEDARKAREIAKLRKDRRKQEHRIKSLEADAKRREAVLKRRQEELAALRRTTRIVSAHQRSSTTSLNSTAGGTSDPAGGAVGGRDQPRAPTWVQVDTPPQPRERVSRRQSSLFSSDGARKKWRDMERKIMDSIMKRQTMTTLAKDMDHWIEKRDQLSQKIEDLRRQREALIRGKVVNMEEVTRVDEDLDSTAAHIEYVQENILEIQNNLIAVEDSKTYGDTLEAHAIITSCTPRESKYLLEHLLDMVLNLGARAEQKELEVRSLAARLQASEQSAELLQSFSSPQVGMPLMGKSRQGPNQPPPPSFNLDADSPPLDSDDSRHSDGRPQSQLPKPGTVAKLRRRTALPTELAASQKKRPPSSAGQEMQVEDLESPDGEGTGAGGSGVSLFRRGSGGAPEVVRRKGLKRRVVGTSSLDVPPGMPAQCPGSPSMGRAMKTSNSEGNVWARLANTSNDSSGDTSKGSLQAEQSDFRKSNPRLLTCTHTACGHHASVLSVCATQTMLFSASQDRTVKVWDLKSGSELLSLDKHFSYVRKVKYCPRSKLIFTASQSLIKIWDLRNYRAKCIKTFGPPSGSGTSSSDSVVQDLLVSSSGHTLFSAAGNNVNIWDLRKFMHCGRLVGHNGALCALTMKGGLMATGSRDRLIKLYDLDAINMDDTSGSVSQAPLCTLYPPHYDAVSSLAVYKDLLFSACGVTIKQWDIKEHSLKQAVDRAHPQGNNIHALGTLSSPLFPLLVSGCKGGILKLWSPENCANIGEVPAHKNSINAIATNDTCIFTGSSDKTIRIWRPSPTQDS